MRLHRTDVLAGALEQLDADGVDALTMRRVADRLHVQPGALYWHFRDKQALFEAMAEDLMSGVALGDERLVRWDERLTRLSFALRRALLSRRDGARLVAGTFVAQPQSVAIGAAFTRAVVDGGTPYEQGPAAAYALFYYILGYVIEEQAHVRLVESGRWADYTASLDTLVDTSMADAVKRTHATHPDRRFQDGLAIFVDGLRARAAITATPDHR